MNEENKEVTNTQETAGHQDVTQERQQQEKSTTDAKNATATESEVKQESEAQRNFRELREKAKRAERERDELKAYLEKLKQQEQPQATPEPEEDYGFSEDDLIEGRQFKRYLKKQKELEKKLAHYEQQSSSMSVEMQLRTKYSDFDKVVTDEAVNKLKESYPELFTTIQTSNNLYAKGAAAYSIIKQYGLNKGPTYDKEQEQIEKNLNKPRPTASVSSTSQDSPLSGANAFANGFTDELKERIRKSNLEAIKRKYS